MLLYDVPVGQLFAHTVLVGLIGWSFLLLHHRHWPIPAHFLPIKYERLSRSLIVFSLEKIFIEIVFNEVYYLSINLQFAIPGPEQAASEQAPFVATLLSGQTEHIRSDPHFPPGK